MLLRHARGSLTAASARLVCHGVSGTIPQQQQRHAFSSWRYDNESFEFDDNVQHEADHPQDSINHMNQKSITVDHEPKASDVKWRSREPTQQLGNVVHRTRANAKDAKKPSWKRQNSPKSSSGSGNKNNKNRSHQPTVVANPHFDALSTGDVIADVVSLSNDFSNNPGLMKHINKGNRHLINSMLEQVLSADAVMEMVSNPASSLILSELVLRGDENYCDAVGAALKGKVVEVCMNECGSNFIRTAFASFSAEQEELLVAEILSSPETVIKCAKHPVGALVIEHLLKLVDPTECAAIAKSLEGHIFELALLVRGHLVVREMLTALPQAEQDRVVAELLSSSAQAVQCANDEFGCILLQDLLKNGEVEHRAHLIDLFKGSVLKLATSDKGSHVIRCAVESLEEHESEPLIDELCGSSESVIACCKDKYGKFVMSALEDRISTDALVDILKTNMMELTCDEKGSFFVKSAFERMSSAERVPLVAELLESDAGIVQLCKHKYAAFVMIYLLQQSKVTEAPLILHAIEGNYVELAMHGRGYGLVRSCLKLPDPEYHDRLVGELLESGDSLCRLAESKPGSIVLQDLLKLRDRFDLAAFYRASRGCAVKLTQTEHGSFVVQVALGVLGSSQRDMLQTELLGSDEDIIASANHKNGSFVMQTLIEKSSARERSKISEALRGKAAEMAQTRHGCYFVNSALDVFEGETREALVDELVTSPEVLRECSMHAFGNFVIQHLVKTGSTADVELVAMAIGKSDGLVMELAKHERGNHVVSAVLKRLPKHKWEGFAGSIWASPEQLEQLQKNSYGKHVYAALTADM